MELEAKRQIISLLQEYGRLLLEVTGMVVKLLELLLNGEYQQLQIVYNEVRKLDKSADENQRKITSEILKSKPYLSNSESIYTLITMMNDIINAMDGAGYRIVYIGLEDLSTEYLEILKDIAMKVYDEADAFNEAIYMLGYNPQELWGAIDKIYMLENQVDEIYRSNVSYVYKTMNNPIHIMRWMEIAERFENAADSIERAADQLISFMLL